LRRPDGSVGHVPIPQWIPHDTADVAVAPHDDDLHPLTEFFAHFAHESTFADRFLPARLNVIVSDPVYYIGLLAAVPTMEAGGIPMVRAGTIGALYQDDIPTKRDNENPTVEPVAHLIDARSRGGFSGSPCLVEKPVIQYEGSTLVMGSWIALLGIIIGHFAGLTPVLPSNDLNSPTNWVARDSSGVVVVVPVEQLREVLNKKQLLDAREAGLVRRKAKQEAKVYREAAELTSSAASVEAVRGDPGLTRRDFDDALYQATRITPPAESAPED